MIDPTGVVLGIDPGIGTTGYGVVDEDRQGGLILVAYGAIETTPGAPMPERLQRLHDEREAILRHYQPESVAVEQLFFGRNVTTAIIVGQARGVVLLAAAQAGAATCSSTSPPRSNRRSPATAMPTSARCRRWSGSCSTSTTSPGPTMRQTPSLLPSAICKAAG